MNQIQKKWYDTNMKLGFELGYPKCCIIEFGLAAPEIIHKFPKSIINIRYEAGCINGKFTGFIPCYRHALMIISGKITLHSLIKNRNPIFPPFPNYANSNL